MQMTERQQAVCSLKAALALQGLNYSTWARAKGFRPQSVSAVIKNFWGTDKQPRGIKTYRILEGLRAYIDNGNSVQNTPENDSTGTPNL